MFVTEISLHVGDFEQSDDLPMMAIRRPEK